MDVVLDKNTVVFKSNQKKTKLKKRMVMAICVLNP
jgi:hypothetical protein